MLTPRIRLPSNHVLDIDDARKHHTDYFRHLFDDGPAACIVTDSACIVIDANRAAETMLLRTLSGMRDRPFQIMIAVSDRQTFKKIAADMLKSVYDTSRPLCMKPRKGADVDVVFKAKMTKATESHPQFISWVFLESLSSTSRDLL